MIAYWARVHTEIDLQTKLEPLRVALVYATRRQVAHAQTSTDITTVTCQKPHPRGRHVQGQSPCKSPAGGGGGGVGVGHRCRGVPLGYTVCRRMGESH